MTKYQVSTRAILIGALIFNFIAIVLSEVQRRSLVERTDEALTGLRQDLNKRNEQSEQVIKSLNRRLIDLQWSVDAPQTLVSDSDSADRQKLEARITSHLNEGKKITIQFDDNPSEDRDKDGNIRCGADTENGYLGVFIATQRYAISYDKATHKWTGTGPVQSKAYDPETATCRAQTATYGPKELGAEVLPGNGDLVLWGDRFKFDGFDVLQSGRKVGRVRRLD